MVHNNSNKTWEEICDLIFDVTGDFFCAEELEVSTCTLSFSFTLFYEMNGNFKHTTIDLAFVIQSTLDSSIYAIKSIRYVNFLNV